jgi:hypothetical protein
MRTFFLSLAIVAGVGAVVAPAPLQEKGGDDRTGPYDVVANWPLPLGYAKPGYIWGSTGGIFAESPNCIFVANRGELKLPATLFARFTGFRGSFNEQATTPTPEFQLYRRRRPKGSRSSRGRSGITSSPTAAACIRC